jgi:hypothetical protein
MANHGPLFISTISFPRSTNKDQDELLTPDFHEEMVGNSGYRNVLGYWEKSSGELLPRLLYTDIKSDLAS